MGFLALELGRKGLQAHQIAIDITGHNISNANTEGYSRQVPTMKADSISNSMYGTLGAGVDVESIERVRNKFLDVRMVQEKAEAGKWDVRETNLRHIEYVLNEPSDESLRFTLDQFWKSMQDLSQNPEDRAVRIIVKERAKDLADTVNASYTQLTTLRNDINSTVKIKVDSVNSMIKQIADVNTQIIRLEAGTKEAHDLRDQRDILIEELSSLVNVSVDPFSKEFSLAIGGHTAIQGDVYHQLKVVSDPEINQGMYTIKWEQNDKEAFISSGELKGLLQIRDEDIMVYSKYMDQLAIGVIDRINEVHTAGFDLNGQSGEEFFGPFEAYPETYDMDNDGADEAAIYRVGGYGIFDPKTETLSQSYWIGNIVGDFEINGVKISYDTSKDSLKDIVDRVNDANIGVVAGYGPYNNLTIRGEKESGYIIRSIEDKNQDLLQKLGILDGGTSFDMENTATLANLTTDRLAKPKEGAASRMYVRIDDVDKIAAASGDPFKTQTTVGVAADQDYTFSTPFLTTSKDMAVTIDGVEKTIVSGVPGAGEVQMTIDAVNFEIDLVFGDAIAGGESIAVKYRIDVPTVGNPSGDGSNAINMGDLKYQKTIGKHNFSDYFESLVSDLGIAAQQAVRFAGTQEVLIDNLEQRRQSEIGVSLDEEMANMIRFQHGYNAAAKFISVADSMIDTLINRI